MPAASTSRPGMVPTRSCRGIMRSCHWRGFTFTPASFKSSILGKLMIGRGCVPTYVYLRWKPFVSRSCSIFRELLKDSSFAANYYNDDHTTAGLHLDQSEFALELPPRARLAHQSIVRCHRRLCSRHHLGCLPTILNLLHTLSRLSIIVHRTHNLYPHSMVGYLWLGRVTTYNCVQSHNLRFSKLDIIT